MKDAFRTRFIQKHLALRRLASRSTQNDWHGLYIVFAVPLGTFTALNPVFLSVENIVNLLQQSSAACVAAVGMVFVFSAAASIFPSAIPSRPRRDVLVQPEQVARVPAVLQQLRPALAGR